METIKRTVKGGDTCLNSLSPSDTGVNNNARCSELGCIQSVGDIIKTLYGIPITFCLVVSFPEPREYITRTTDTHLLDDAILFYHSLKRELESLSVK